MHASTTSSLSFAGPNDDLTPALPPTYHLLLPYTPLSHPPPDFPAGSCGAGEVALADGARSVGAKHPGQQGEDGKTGGLLDGGAVAM